MAILFSFQSDDATAEEAGESFRGGLLSLEPSASAPSVKNDETSLPSDTNRQGKDGGAQEAVIENHSNEEEPSASHQSETHHLPEPPIIDPTRRPPQPKKEPCSNQAPVLVPRSAKPTPKGASSQTPFKKPSSTATMKLSRTPSSRSIVSSRSNASPSSTPTTAVPVTINILALSDRDNHPYQSLKPKYTCTLKVMPQTKAKEICLHAAEYMSRKFNVFLDGSRFEVRNQEGYLFRRVNIISEEFLNGDPLYLIKDAVSENGKQKERDDLSRLQALEKSARKGGRRTGPYRTPSLSSRTSSSTRKWSQVTKSEPKKAPTAAQTVLELAQTRSVPRPASQRPTSGGKLLQPEPMVNPVRSKPSASPGKGLPVVPFAASTTPRRKWTVRREPSAEQQETDKSALVEVVASQKSLPSPESSPAPQDDAGLVIPDSQQDPASPSPSPKKTPVQKQLAPPMLPKLEPKNALQPPEAQPRSAPPTKIVDTSISIVSSVAPPTSLPSRPDPYDISTVLSDDDNCPQKPSMSSLACKLGSSRKRAPAAAPPAAQRPALSSTRPSSPMKDKPPPAFGQTVFTSTPTRPTPTPNRAGPSSLAVPLPSSPTNHVAAVIAKDRAQKKPAPQNEAFSIDDSADEVDENLLQEAPQLFSSKQSQPSESLAHWTGPPKLEFSEAHDPFWAVRSVGSRPATSKTENDDDTRSQMRRLGELGGSQAMRTGSGQLKPRAQPSSASSPPKASLSETSPLKKRSTVFSGRYPLGFPSASHYKDASKTDVGKSPAIEIHSSPREKVDQVDGGIADKGSSALEQVPSPSKKTEPIVIFDTSSQYESEEEERGDPNEVGLVPAAERSSPPEDLPLAEELSVEYTAGLPDEEEPELPNLRQETPPFSTAPEGLAQSQSKAETFVELPSTDPFVADQNEESPPSAQPSKRMREPSNEPDPEEEERKKKARRADKKAKKSQLREEKKALEEQKPALSEEHKRLAAEQAWHRAQELVVDLSSPSKDANRDAEYLSGYDSSDESDADDDPNPATPKFPSLAEPDKFEEDDNNDSLSSKETEGRSSWRELSKRHFSESPKCSQKYGQQGASKPNATPTVKPRCQRELYDDWDFLEAHLGRSYEAMDVHNRIHMQTLHQDIRHAMATGLEQATEPAAEETSKATIRLDEPVQTKMKRDSKQQEVHDAHGAHDPDGGAVKTLKKEQQTPNRAKISKMSQKRREKTTSRKKRQQRKKTKAHFKRIRDALVEGRC